MSPPVSPMSRITVGGAPEGFDARLILDEADRSGGRVVHVARDDKRMQAMREALAFFAPGMPVFSFPSWDCLPFDRVSPNPDISAARMATLAALDPRDAAPLRAADHDERRDPARPRPRHPAGGRLHRPCRPPDRRKRAPHLPRPHGLHAGPHGDRTRRLRRARRDHRHLPAGGGRSRPARPLRRRARRRAPLRPRDPAHDREARGRRTRPGLRGHPRRGRDHPLPPRLPHRVRRGRHRRPALRGGQRGPQARRAEHWLPFFHDRLETLFDYLPGAPVFLDDQPRRPRASPAGRRSRTSTTRGSRR
jgi:transcription-repair coupling factor (superfamily II helicase)